ncbi:MAG: hypothetical protein II625_10810 [Bacilli bacterium]|nr:hypothetical protein [Bacilli bacterium]
MALSDKYNKENFYEIGKQFAYEGLDETYLKDATPEQIEEFRKGFSEVQKEINNHSRSDELLVDNDSRSMHR